jgi:hypothetical protein
VKRTKRLQAKLNTTVKTSPDWEGFSRGDVVKIVGERGLFSFIGFCENLESGDSWVALFGGDKDPGGRQQFRYVYPDRVKRVNKRRNNGSKT